MKISKLLGVSDINTRSKKVLTEVMTMKTLRFLDFLNFFFFTGPLLAPSQKRCNIKWFWTARKKENKDVFCLFCTSSRIVLKITLKHASRSIRPKNRNHCSCNQQNILKNFSCFGTSSKTSHLSLDNKCVNHLNKD